MRTLNKYCLLLVLTAIGCANQADHKDVSETSQPYSVPRAQPAPVRVEPVQPPPTNDLPVQTQQEVAVEQKPVEGETPVVKDEATREAYRRFLQQQAEANEELKNRPVGREPMGTAMKAVCPNCGATSTVWKAGIDGTMRCSRCGALMRGPR